MRKCPKLYSLLDPKLVVLLRVINHLLGESMAEAAAISAGFKLLAPAATELLKKGYSLLDDMDVDEKLWDLQNETIPYMEILIDAAEKSPHTYRLLRWLQSLQEAVDEAEDVLDLHHYYLLEQKVKGSAGGIMVLNNFMLNYQMLVIAFLFTALEKRALNSERRKELVLFLTTTNAKEAGGVNGESGVVVELGPNPFVILNRNT